MRKRAGELVKGDFVAVWRDKDKEAVAVEIVGVGRQNAEAGLLPWRARFHLPTFRYRVLTGEDKEKVFSSVLDLSQEVEVFESAAAAIESVVAAPKAPERKNP